MRVAIAAEGTRGDIYPMLALARHLIASGHEVRMCFPPDFAAEAHATGGAFFPLGVAVKTFIDECAGAVHGGGLAMAREMGRFAGVSIASQFAVLPDVVAGCDRVFGAGTIVAAASAAELHGVPYRAVFYTPGILPSAEHTPCVLPFQTRGRRRNRLLWWLAARALNLATRRDVNRGRSALGLPPVREVIGHVASERPLVAVDRPLAPMPADCPFDWEQIRCLHPLDGEPLPAKLESFLEQGPPPIYVGFGSMPDPDPAATTRRLLDALGALDRRVILSSGWAGLGEGPLPEGVLTIGPVCHARLFPRVAAVVHHGGAGTTHSAARAGVPQVIVPHVLDQFYFARRVEDLGVGVATRAAGKRDVAGLVAAIAAVTENEWVSERARALGAELAALGPAEPDLDRLLAARS